jgi:hypothetical protein
MVLGQACRKVAVEDLDGVAAREPLLGIFHLEALGANLPINAHLPLHEERNDQPVDIVPLIAGSEEFVELLRERDRRLLAGNRVSGGSLSLPE